MCTVGGGSRASARWNDGPKANEKGEIGGFAGGFFARAGAHLRVEVAHVERRILVAIHRLLTEEVGSGAGSDAPARESHGRHRASAGRSGARRAGREISVRARFSPPSAPSGGEKLRRASRATFVSAAAASGGEDWLSTGAPLNPVATAHPNGFARRRGPVARTPSAHSFSRRRPGEALRAKRPETRRRPRRPS